MVQKRPPVALIILDGFGYSSAQEGNAIRQAYMPTVNSWYQRYPYALLQASGEAVGLLPGMIGNSEVGHITIGAGKVVQQPITVLLEMIHNQTFLRNPILVKAFSYVKHKKVPLHLIGLLSDAGVHGHEHILYALIASALHHDVDTIILHLFLDGRDVPPRSAAFYLEKLESVIRNFKRGTVIIGSVHGRFYAMDRDEHWDRTEKSIALLIGKAQQRAPHWRAVLDSSYAEKIYDEFILPTSLNKDAFIRTGDGVIFFNTRPERMHQLVSMLLNQGPRLGFVITTTPYSKELPADVLYERSPVEITLLDRIAQEGLTIFTITESEKYAHVTYYISGERVIERPQEHRVRIPSLRLASYSDAPAMSAAQITDAIIASLNQAPCDFYLVNYANADMVGHSGNLQATIEAVQILDHELGRLYKTIVIEHKGTMFVTADHGNAEEMWDYEHNQPHTAHTLNQVPFFMISPSVTQTSLLPLHNLADIAPFILSYLRLPPL